MKLRELSPSFNIKKIWLREAIPYIKGKVLDIGSGDCLLADFVENNADMESMTRTDIEPGRTDVKRMNAEKLGFNKDSFDTVLAIDVAEHVKDDIAMMSEIYRILKPKGYLIFSLPLDPTLFNAWDRSAGHFRRYTWRKAFELIEGFSVEILHTPPFSVTLFKAINPRRRLKTLKACGLWIVCQKNKALTKEREQG